MAIDACVLTGNEVHLLATPGGRRRVGRQGSVRATTKVEPETSSRSPAAGDPRRLTAPAFAHRGAALAPLRPAFTPELRRLVARSPGAGMVF